MKVSYVAYIKDEVIADCLNAIRCFIKPDTAYPAHVTVRGPYPHEIDIDPFNKQAQGILLVLDGVGRFAPRVPQKSDTPRKSAKRSSPGQHVVFLSCTAPRLKNVWWKPDYSFVPHLTLYQGPSQKEADEIFTIASQHTYGLCTRVAALEPLIVGGDPSLLRPVSFHEQNISLIARQNILRETIKIMPRRERMNAMHMILRHLEYLSDFYPYDAELTWNRWEGFRKMRQKNRIGK